MPELIALMLVVSALVACLLPLLQEEPSAQDEEEFRRGTLLSERDEVLSAIREADLDLAMGKVSIEDHAALRASLETRAMALLSEIEAEGVR